MNCKKIITLENVIEFIYIALAVVFTIFIFFKNDVLALIFGILLLTALVFNLMYPVFKKGRISAIGWIALSFNFVVAIILFCSFICSLPDKYGLKDVFTAVGASCIGGFLTLYGVGLSIKYNRLDKQEDEIKRLKPRVFLMKSKIKMKKMNFYSSNVEVRFCELKSKKGEQHHFDTIRLVNGDVSSCAFFGVLVNNKLVKFEYEVVIPKDSVCEFNIKYNVKVSNIKSIKLLLSDSLYNIYASVSSFEVIRNRDSSLIVLNSLYEGDLWGTGDQYFYEKIAEKKKNKG